MIHGLGPRTRRIFDLLRERILSGELAPGTQLPPHRKLAEEFGVASMTIRHVLARLEEAGLVSRELGRGTFVRSTAAPSVLLVAEPALASELSAYIRQAAARAVVVSDFSSAAVALARDPGVGLVVSAMPPGARDFLRLVHERWPELPTAVVSASPADLEPLYGTPEWPTRVLSTPVRASQVEDLLRSTLAREHRRSVQPSIDDLVDPCLLVHRRTAEVRQLNPSAAELLGYSLTDTPDLTLDSLVPERVQAELRATHPASEHPLLAAREPLDLPVLTADGRELTVELTASALGDGSVLLLLRDRTAQRATENRLGFLSQLLEAVEQAVVATDPQARIIYWNRGAERLYGWRADEALGRNAGEVIVAPELLARGREIMDRLRQGLSWSGEFPVRRRDGTTVPVLVTDSPVFDRDGRLTGIIGIAADLTERKRAEAERLARARVEARLLATEAALVREIASRLSP